MTKPKSKPQTVGRRQWDGKDEALIIKKLEEAFAYGCTDIEACFYAGVSTQSLYKYQKKNPSFVERKHTLKQSPVLKARQTVVLALSNDPNLAFRYLERKRSMEFATHIRTKAMEATLFDNLTAGELEAIIKATKF